MLKSKDEINILKKISEWPKCIDTSSNKLEPHRIPTYLFELYYNLILSNTTNASSSLDFELYTRQH